MNAVDACTRGAEPVAGDSELVFEPLVLGPYQASEPGFGVVGVGQRCGRSYAGPVRRLADPSHRVDQQCPTTLASLVGDPTVTDFAGQKDPPEGRRHAPGRGLHPSKFRQGSGAEVLAVE